MCPHDARNTQISALLARLHLKRRTVEIRRVLAHDVEHHLRESRLRAAEHLDREIARVSISDSFSSAMDRIYRREARKGCFCARRREALKERRWSVAPVEPALGQPWMGRLRFRWAGLLYG